MNTFDFFLKILLFLLSPELDQRLSAINSETTERSLISILPTLKIISLLKILLSFHLHISLSRPPNLLSITSLDPQQVLLTQ